VIELTRLALKVVCAGSGELGGRVRTRKNVPILMLPQVDTPSLSLLNGETRAKGEVGAGAPASMGASVGAAVSTGSGGADPPEDQRTPRRAARAR